MLSSRDIAQCNLIEIDQLFILAYLLLRQDDDEIRVYETSVTYFRATWRSIPENYHLIPPLEF